MDFTALRYFCETANTRSIRAASERLHVAPSAISRQIAKLEHELRAPIFDRRADGMTLTAAGELLQSRVEEIMREFSRVKSHITALQNLQSGTIDIYCFRTATETIIAPVLNEFHIRYPNVSFNITMSSTDETIEALTNRTAEIGLVVNPPVRDTILSTQIFRDSIVAVCAPNHPLTGGRIVSLREVAEFPLGLTEPSFGHRQQIDKAFERCAIDPNVFCVTNSLGLLKRIARFDRQCTLLPSFAVENEVASGTLSTIAVKEFTENPMVFCICVLNSRPVSPAAKVFVDTIVGFCQRYVSKQT